MRASGCGLEFALALALISLLESRAGAASPAALGTKLSQLLVDAVNDKFGVDTLFGIYSVKKVKSRSLGRMSVEIEVKETICKRPQVLDPTTCEFSLTAAPALWECKAAVVVGTNTEALAVRYLHCEPSSSEESESSEEKIAWFVNARYKMGLVAGRHPYRPKYPNTVPEPQPLPLQMPKPIPLRW